MVLGSIFAGARTSKMFLKSLHPHRIEIQWTIRTRRDAANWRLLCVLQYLMKARIKSETQWSSPKIY